MTRSLGFIAVLCAVAALSSVAIAGQKHSDDDGADDSSSAPTTPTLAVLDLASSPDLEDIAPAATDALNSELIKTKAFTVVERRRIAHVIREQALGQTGAISEKSAVKVGRLLGARLLVIGRLSHIGTILRLDCRTIDSETAKIVAAHFAEFHDRDNLDLAVAEVAQGLANAVPGGKSVSASGKAVDAAKPAIVIDAAKLHQATVDVVKRIGAKFVAVKAKLTNVDDTGHATFRPGGRLVFAGMRFEVFGVDDMTGGRMKKGIMVVKRVDGTSADGPTESEASPIATGDDVTALPFTASVTAPTQAIADAMTEGLSTLTNFSTDANSGGTPVKVVVEIKGDTIGSRHLTVSVVDSEDTAQGTFESNIDL